MNALDKFVMINNASKWAGYLEKQTRNYSVYENKRGGA